MDLSTLRQRYRDQNKKSRHHKLAVSLASIKNSARKRRNRDIVIELFNNGMSKQDIMNKLDLCRQTVNLYIRESQVK